MGATMVGVGAIVGGGVLALAGTAFATAGPAALVAFALNGVIAFITARSFAGTPMVLRTSLILIISAMVVSRLA